MDNAFERLQTASHKLAEAIYSQAAAPGAEGAADEQASTAAAGADDETTAAADDNVIDAEYVDVEDENKK
jgi:molecular chaperone DnaK